MGHHAEGARGIIFGRFLVGRGAEEAREAIFVDPSCPGIRGDIGRSRFPLPPGAPLGPRCRPGGGIGTCPRAQMQVAKSFGCLDLSPRQDCLAAASALFMGGPAMESVLGYAPDSPLPFPPCCCFCLFL